MNLEILDISWNKFNVNELINIANISTMIRKHGILKLYVGHTNFNNDNDNDDLIHELNPFCKVYNSSSSLSDGEIYRKICDSL